MERIDFICVFLIALILTNVFALSESHYKFQNLFDDENEILHIFKTEDEANRPPDMVLKGMIPHYMHDLLSSFSADPELFLSGLLENVVNKNCASDLVRMLLKLLVLDTGALHMIDAWGKFPEGIFSGHLAALGDFDECINLNSTVERPGQEGKFEISGTYCSTYVFPFVSNNTSNETEEISDSFLDTLENVEPRKAASIVELIKIMLNTNSAPMIPILGTCLPSSCDASDAQIVLNNGISLVNNTSPITIGLYMYVNACYTNKKPDFDTGDITMIVVLSVIGLFCAVGTLVDIFYHRRFKSNNTMQAKLGKLYESILAFSLYTNTKKWMNTKEGPDSISCVHGIRFFSMSWVVLAHTWAMMFMQPVWNMVDVKTIYKQSWTLYPLINGTVSVDSFFLMSGLLVAYGMLKALDKSKGRLNILLLYLHRYLRLTPTYLILIGMMATLFPYFGYGPNWFIIDLWSKFCKKNWWHNIFYANNLIYYGDDYFEDGMCLPESWYLANDMQFFILSPLIVYPIWKWEKIGVGFLAILSCASILIPGVIAYVNENLPTYIPFRDGFDEYQVDQYERPWTRIGPYLAGIWLGLLLYKTKNKKIRMSKYQVVFGWLLSTGSALAIIFGVMPYFDPDNDVSRVGAAFYAGFHRFVWGVVVAWIIFACVKGYGGFVNTFLSWKIFIPLGRLTYCMYLISYHLQMLFHIMYRQAVTYDVYNMTNLFLAHMAMSLLAGYICTITMESPFMQLEKLIFEPKKKENPPNNPNLQENKANV